MSKEPSYTRLHSALQAQVSCSPMRIAHKGLNGAPSMRFQYSQIEKFAGQGFKGIVPNHAP